MGPDLRFTYHSDRYFEITGFRPEDKIGSTRTRFVDPSDPAAGAETWDAHIADLEARRPFKNFEYPFKVPNGSIFHARTSGIPAFDQEGAFLGYRGTGTDITELKKAEEALRDSEKILQQLNDQKDKFFSIIAHDQKGPFNALLGYTSLLSSGVADFNRDKVVEYSDAVHESAEWVFKLLENLLEWALLQRGRMEFEPAPMNLKEIIDTNLELFTPAAQEKAIRLTTKRKHLLNVFADVRMVDTVVRNLVNNAIKFTPEKGQITISARENGKWAEVEVTDTGVGISADKAALLFRLDEKTSTVGTGGETGTGLGLILCKELVEKQGGEIYVESAEGEGSAFRFTLPLHPP